MEMDFSIISKYNVCVRKARENDMIVQVSSNTLMLCFNNTSASFFSIDELYGFLCGYEWGKSKSVKKVNKRGTK